MKVENEIRSSLQLSGILTDEVKIEIREEVTAWQKSQFNPVFYFQYLLNLSVCVCIYPCILSCSFMCYSSNFIFTLYLVVKSSFYTS